MINMYSWVWHEKYRKEILVKGVKKININWIGNKEMKSKKRETVTVLIY